MAMAAVPEFAVCCELALTQGHLQVGFCYYPHLPVAGCFSRTSTLLDFTPLLGQMMETTNSSASCQQAFWLWFSFPLLTPLF